MQNKNAVYFLPNWSIIAAMCAADEAMKLAIDQDLIRHATLFATESASDESSESAVFEAIHLPVWNTEPLINGSFEADDALALEIVDDHG